MNGYMLVVDNCQSRNLAKRKEVERKKLKRWRENQHRKFYVIGSTSYLYY